eukprot:CAMPEP_0182543302 /NCGR_PEP_ID=MMETSP1323-20130603/31449_1 /TAXON_ID=236787 /ORGANISM="Florenciella parvula, Strain RCC1693" /LENGTH=157 /DNA_ID=CAMNT_0024754229 /DNA_START=69 /DNA_END=538 /DNA_ORIENTATION=+
MSYRLHLAIPIASPSTANAPAPTTPHQSRPGSADAMFPPPSLAPCAPPSAPPPCGALPASVLPDEADADAEADAELDEFGLLNAPAVPVVLEEASNGSFLFDAVEGSNLSAASIACSSCKAFKPGLRLFKGLCCATRVCFSRYTSCLEFELPGEEAP